MSHPIAYAMEVFGLGDGFGRLLLDGRFRCSWCGVPIGPTQKTGSRYRHRNYCSKCSKMRAGDDATAY